MVTKMPATPAESVMEPVLELTDVHRRTGGTMILKEIDWRIDQGQHWVVLGPNGSGKSTLLRIAGLHLHPTTGTVRVLGGELGRSDIVDYTSTTPEMADRPSGQWLRTYRGHERGGEPTEVPGSQDVTVEVAVDQLPPGAVADTQAAFLRRYGIDNLVEAGRRLWEERAHLGDLEAIRARSRVTEAEALLDPTGLGGFTVLEWVCS